MLMYPDSDRSIITDYWRSDRILINLGDYITELLIRKFGYQPILYEEGGGRNFDRCLLIIGSLIDSRWFSRIKCEKNIWGCGYWGDQKFSLLDYQHCRFHAVRGPVTRDALGLPANIPIGDPGLLLSRFWPMEADWTEEAVAYVPHFNNRNSIGREFMSYVGAAEFIDISCTREMFWDSVRNIVNSKFLLTSSLHAAIIAQSYGRPWALCAPKGMPIDKPLKWTDWFEYLGISGEVCPDLSTGLKWWRNEGSKGVIRDLDPLISSFPHPDE